ncbi:phosphoglycerate kinase [Candidatus Uhrbacteria bacterium]|nr:phosphoglycerate kinase [Candidatus Uhrbacteria bacterium]
MIKLRTIDFSTLKGRHVILRVDINVPVEGSIPRTSVRLTSALDTIKKLQTAGAKTIVFAHRGRPKGVDLKFSLEPIAKWFMKELAGDTVFFQPVAAFKDLKARVQTMAHGDVVFIENLRFHPGEKANDPEFAEQLASLGEVYINDAFGNSHRDHASMTGITQYVDSYAGPGIAHELEALESVLNPTKSPFVAIVGGAKISSKLHAIEHMLAHADQVFIGGAIATAFFAAQGKEVGTSFMKDGEIEFARKLMGHHALKLPTDVLVKSAAGKYRSINVLDIQKDEAIVDIGRKAVADISEAARHAKLILWNGPMGIVEEEQSRVGSDAVAHIVAEVARGKAYGVIGGGDTVNLPFELGIAEFIDHISTGGGAMLEYVGGQELPALEVLKQK